MLNLTLRLERNGFRAAHQRRTRGKKILTRHTGLPPRTTR
jgi:hypothetical protein